MYLQEVWKQKPHKIKLVIMFLESVEYSFSGESKRVAIFEFCLVASSELSVTEVYLAQRLAFHRNRVGVHTELNAFEDFNKRHCRPHDKQESPPFLMRLQQDTRCHHCQLEDSDRYRPGIQKICELLRIQITTSVNCREGGS